jgi:hypothetical protein
MHQPGEVRSAGRVGGSLGHLAGRGFFFLPQRLMMFASGVSFPEGLPISRRKPRSVSAPLMVGASFLETSDLPHVQVFGAARGAWPRSRSPKDAEARFNSFPGCRASLLET